MSEAPVELSIEGGIARLTLNRPDAANAFNEAMTYAFADAVAECSGNANVRCVVLTGSGRYFCGGGDVRSFAAWGSEAPAKVAMLARLVHGAVARLARMNSPVLVLVNGPAAGFGLSLAILGDVVLAAKSASFTAAYTGIGLTPDGGMSWFLPRVAGLRKAQEMILTNRVVGADEAEQIGLISRAIDDDALGIEGRTVAARLARSARTSLGTVRSLLLGSFSTSLEDQLDREAACIAAACGGPEFREGAAAFVEKRNPDFLRI